MFCSVRDGLMSLKCLIVLLKYFTHINSILTLYVRNTWQTQIFALVIFFLPLDFLTAQFLILMVTYHDWELAVCPVLG